ncbi:MAG: hypothetical protein ACLFUI_03245, partial [Halanaerobiales bacterium]
MRKIKVVLKDFSEPIENRKVKAADKEANRAFFQIFNKEISNFELSGREQKISNSPGANRLSQISGEKEMETDVLQKSLIQLEEIFEKFISKDKENFPDLDSEDYQHFLQFTEKLLGKIINSDIDISSDKLNMLESLRNEVPELLDSLTTMESNFSLTEVDLESDIAISQDEKLSKLSFEERIANYLKESKNEILALAEDNSEILASILSEIDSGNFEKYKDINSDFGGMSSIEYTSSSIHNPENTSDDDNLLMQSPIKEEATLIDNLIEGEELKTSNVSELNANKDFLENEAKSPEKSWQVSVDDQNKLIHILQNDKSINRDFLLENQIRHDNFSKNTQRINDIEKGLEASDIKNVELREVENVEFKDIKNIEVKEVENVEFKDVKNVELKEV